MPNVDGQPTTGDKAVAAATYLATNAGAAAMPLLPLHANPMSLGGPEIPIISHGINALIQALKMHKWFKQDKWAMWVELGLGFAICMVLYHTDPVKGILNGLSTAAMSMSNYGHLNTLEVLPPGV